MAREDEERIVDAHGKPQHDGEEWGGGGNGDDVGEAKQNAHHNAHAHDRARKRHPCGPEGAERDDKHQPGKGHTNHFGDRQTDLLVLKHVAAVFDDDPRVLSE